jgi:hypothetical protein
MFPHMVRSTRHGVISMAGLLPQDILSKGQTVTIYLK